MIIYYQCIISIMKGGSNMSDNKNNFTKEEEERIQAALKAQQDKIREAEIEMEILNRVLDEQRKKPGYKY